MLSAVLKLALLVGPLLAVVATVGSADIAHVGMLMAVWSLPTALAMQLDFERQPMGLQGEMTLAALTAVKTLEILNDARDSSDETIWLCPLLATIVFTLLVDRESKPVGTISYNKRGGLLLSAIVGGTGMALAFLDSSLSTYSLLLAIEAALGVTLMGCVLTEEATHQTRDVWRGGSTLVLSWLFLQACTLPINVSGGSTVLAVQLSAMCAVVAVSILMVEDDDASIRLHSARIPLLARFFNATLELVLTAVDLVRMVLGSAVAYQAVVIACLAVIASTVDKPWYAAHADFPDQPRRLSDTALSLINGAVRWVYELTSNPEIQEIMVAAAPEVGNVRGTVYRAIAPGYKWLMLASDGVSYSFTPTGSLPCLVGLLLGPIVAAMGILAQVMNEGAAFARSQWFWAFATFGSMLFLMITHMQTGTRVTLLGKAFPDAPHERVYTADGEFGLLAQVVLTLACAALFVVLSQTESVEQRMASKRAHRLGARAQPGLALRVQLTVALAVQRFTRYITSPSFLLALGALVLLVVVASAGPSPVRTFEVVKITSSTPEWLVSTDADKACIVSQTLVSMLTTAIGPEVRLGLLLQVLIKVGIEQLNCVGCFCVPGGEAVSWLEGAGGTIGGGFGSRRLLEYDEAYGNGTSPLKGRSLLAYDPDVSEGCSRGSASCSTYNICVSDLLKPVAALGEFMTKMLSRGLTYAVEFVVKSILAKIPAVAKLIDAFAQLEGIFAFDGFHPFNFADFSFRPLDLFTLNLGALPSFRLPSISAPSTFTIVAACLLLVACLVLIYRLGLLDPVFTSVFQGLELAIVTGSLSFAITVALSLYAMADELKLYGYEVIIELDSSVMWLYLLVAGMLLMSLLFWVGERSAKELNKLEAALYRKV